MGVDTDFIHLESGMTRINVKLKADCESEINGQGPAIGKEHLQQLFDKLQKLQEGDVLVLAGSIPGSLPSDIYEKIMQQLQGRQIMVVVDATRELLCNVLKYKPFLIKPNHIELGEIFGVELQNDQQIREYAGKLQERGRTQRPSLDGGSGGNPARRKRRFPPDCGAERDGKKFRRRRRFDGGGLFGRLSAERRLWRRLEDGHCNGERDRVFRGACNQTRSAGAV